MSNRSSASSTSALSVEVVDLDQHFRLSGEARHGTVASGSPSRLSLLWSRAGEPFLAQREAVRRR